MKRTVEPAVSDGIASELQMEREMQDRDADGELRKEQRQIRRELARERRGRPPARCVEPFRQAAVTELRTDAIAAGDRDQHVQHRRQQRAQQELRIIGLRIDERITLDDEPSRPETAAAAGEPRRHRRERRAQRGRREIAGRVELLVVEDDDLRPLARQRVAFEMLRKEHDGEVAPRADRMHRGRRDRRNAPRPPRPAKRPRPAHRRAKSACGPRPPPRPAADGSPAR